MLFLKELKNDRYKLLEQYTYEIEQGDSTNREAHAAKVYFNSLYGNEFSRVDDCNINAALNYGYSLLLSAFNREISKNGYLTQIGIFHDNMFNHFNLSCDFMEPFRPIIDRKVYSMKLEKFDSEEKLELIDLINSKVNIDSKNHYLLNAIQIYTKSIFDALDDSDLSLIKMYKYEL